MTSLTHDLATELSKRDKLLKYENLGLYGVIHVFLRSTDKLLCTISVQAAYNRIAHYKRIPAFDIFYTGNRSRFVDAWITSI